MGPSSPKPSRAGASLRPKVRIGGVRAALASAARTPPILTLGRRLAPARLGFGEEGPMERYKRAALAAPFLLPICDAALAQQVSGNAFNPAISLILNGHYASYSRDPAAYEISGFLLDEEAGLASEGLSLDETELA